MISYVNELGRIIFGAYFVYSGINHFINVKGMTGYASSKGVPMPKAAVIISGLLIVLGGLGILFNIYVDASAFLVVLFLLPVTLSIHNFWSDKDPQVRAINRVNFFKNLALLGATLMLFF